LYDLNLTESVALLFGNEHKGVSEAALTYCDGNFLIPQYGMVQSLNISVACAVSVYEALRQRKASGFYSDNPVLNETEQAELYEQYQLRHEQWIDEVDKRIEAK
jgi:tRNA (guanosine-2'-O-)-methyltransferase